MPEPPQCGALDAFSFSIDAQAVRVSDFGVMLSDDLSFDAPAVLAMEEDLPLVSPEFIGVGIGGFEFDVAAVPPEAFVSISTDGTLFFKEQRLGRPTSQPAIRRPSSQSSAPSRAESLLTMLLPVLLPPVRSDLTSEPLALPKPLYAFQGDGVRWLVEHKPGALLADEMGLGKTVQAIVALRRLFREGQATQALVVCPKAVVTSWHRHFREWAPELEVLVVAGSAVERLAQWRALNAGRSHVAIATFDAVVRDVESVVPIAFSVLVVDEIQNLKNPQTKRAQEMGRIVAKRRWGLTGTPLENRVEELGAIVRFLDRTLLPTREPSPAAIKGAAAKIMLRRRKDVLVDLPELRCRVEYVTLGSRERGAYEQAESEGVARLRRGIVNVTNVLSLITALKQICNGVEGESAKTEWVEEYLDSIAGDGDRALVFSQYVETLNHLKSKLRVHSPHFYTGSMNATARQAVVDDFQSDTTSSRVMLMSLKAGGVGITLTKANHVVHFDSWWNPAVASQATARAHRIGQEKVVIETTLVAEDTVEDRIQRILDEKRELFDAVVNDLTTEGLPRVLTEREIFGLFGLQPPAR